MTKIVSFVAQKGGSGKSTMTLIMANYFAYNEKKNVVVIDGDAPQYSLGKLRKSEMEDEDSINKKVLSSHVNSDVETYPIYQCVPSENQEQPEENIYSVSKVIDALYQQGNIDYIFIDLAGTLNSPEIIEILKKVNYIFIPFMEASNLYFSNYEALYIVTMIVKNSENSIKGVYEFWHKYRSNMSVRIFYELAEKFDVINDNLKKSGINASMMQSKIGNSTKAFAPEIWNTIAPIPDNYLSVLTNGLNLGNFIKEFKNLTNE